MFLSMVNSRRKFSGALTLPARAVLIALLFAGLSGCEAKPASKVSGNPEKAPSGLPTSSTGAPPAQPPSSGAKKPQANLLSLPTREQVEAIVNPKKEAAYSGPTATIRGVVRATGDAAPVVALKDVDRGCEMAEPMFGRLFREGKDRTLGDVFVAVTHYQGHVPPRTGSVKVFGQGCAWDRRTIGIELGQYIEVVAKDRRPYVPELLGERTVAQLFALPDADPIALVPTKLGRFVVHDSMRIYSRANLFVVGYPTHDVTDIDGVFEITGIPVGKAKVGALLPETGSTVIEDVELQAGEVLTVNFDLPFNQKAYDLSMKKAAQELQGATRATNK
jgi:molybdopterin synthase catalytic subunit